MKSTRLCRWCRYGRVVDRTHGDAELQEALAKESGAKVEFVRCLEQLRRGIIEQALRDGKKVFVNGIAAELVAHNYPSGDPVPSEGDIEMTRKLVAAGKLMNIPVLDHLIIGVPSDGNSGFFSLAASELVEF